jgi:hypothetical protein
MHWCDISKHLTIQISVSSKMQKSNSFNPNQNFQVKKVAKAVKKIAKKVVKAVVKIADKVATAVGDVVLKVAEVGEGLLNKIGIKVRGGAKRLQRVAY